MKQTDRPALQAAREQTAEAHLSYALLFDQLHDEAEAERAQEEDRGHPFP